MRPFVTANEVAELVGLASAAAFLARRAGMERDMLFPRPMPHQRRPMIWRANEVTAWVARQGRPQTSTLIDAGHLASGKVVLMQMATSA